jgi:hypothetical protein
MLLFKRKAVAHAPGPMLLRAGWGSMRSAVFLAMFVAIYQGLFSMFCPQTVSYGLRVNR